MKGRLLLISVRGARHVSHKIEGFTHLVSLEFGNGPEASSPLWGLEKEAEAAGLEAPEDAIDAFGLSKSEQPSETLRRNIYAPQD